MSIESTQQRSLPPSTSAETKPYQAPIPPTGKERSALEINTKSATSVTAGLPVQPMRNLPLWLLFNLILPLLLLAAAIYLVFWLGTVESPARPPIDDTKAGRLFALPAVDVVTVQSLASTGQKLELTTDGTVVPFREIVLATEVAGQIIKKSPKCETGKFVRKGDVLIVIDPTDYELEVKRLRRLQQQEYESLGEIDQEMSNTDRSMELARTDIELQGRELKRQQSLPSQFASKGEVDQAKRALLQAEQALLTLQNQLELSKKRRIRLQSTEQLAKMQLEAAENNLRRTKIKAPMDGVVVSEQAELNTFVARGSPVVTIEDTSKVEVAASLRTDQLYWVLNQEDQETDPLSLSQPDGSQVRGYRLPDTPVKVQYQLSGREDLTYQWSGRLVGYDGIGLDEQTRTVPVRIVVDDPQDITALRDGQATGNKNNPSAAKMKSVGPSSLVRGMFVNLRLQLSPSVELVVLPGESLKPGNRIWQFVPDPTVLEQSLNDEELLADPEIVKAIMDSPVPNKIEKVPTKVDLTDKNVADEEASSKALAGKGFAPAEWVAGNLHVVHGIRAVDRFVGERGKANDDESPSWICEVPQVPGDNGGGLPLGDGSFVIVSPLGSLPGDVVPVRAPAEMVKVAGKIVAESLRDSRDAPIAERSGDNRTDNNLANASKRGER